MKNYQNLLQNVIITLLSVSAVLLLTQTQLYSLDLLSGYDEAASSPAAAAPSAEFSAPVRAAVTGAYGRYANIALTTGQDAFTELLGRRLLEALGSAREYVPCTRQDFLRALGETSLYYDFLAPLPLSVLAGLAGGGEEVSPREDLNARRLLIAAQDSGAMLYLWDGEDACFRAATAVSADSLAQAVSRYELGNAAFAMDDGSGGPAPCSLLPFETPDLPAFTLGDPLATTDWLLSALGFNPRNRTRHTESNGTELIMDGDRTIRIRPDSSVFYQSGRDPSLRISAAGEIPTLREAALGAGSLLSGLLAPVSGDARPYLQSLRRSENVTVLRFGYQAGGVPVRFQDGGFAAELTLTGVSVTGLTVRFRQYNRMEESSLLLPLAQALAVAGPGRELSIGYVERSGESRACWLSD